MAREKTPFRHVNKYGKVIKVTRENDILYIGNNDDIVGRKFKHFKQIHPENSFFGIKGNKIFWQDEWQENNLNGGFAYNGATDDF